MTSCISGRHRSPLDHTYYYCIFSPSVRPLTSESVRAANGHNYVIYIYIYNVIAPRSLPLPDA